MLALRGLVFVLVWAWLPAMSGAEEIRYESCEELLSVEQLESLQSASRSKHYFVRVMAGQVGGRVRTVVILGEGAHTKSEVDSELGKMVLSAFSNYGLEGANSSLTWGGRILRLPGRLLRKAGLVRTIDPFQANLQPDGRLHVRARGMSFDSAPRPNSMGRAVYGMGDLPSTITEAYFIGRERKMRLIEDLRGIESRYELNKLSRGEADKFQIHIGSRSIDGSDVSKEIEILTAQAEKSPRDVNLERRHLPGTLENVGSIAIPGMLSLCAVELTRVVCDVGQMAVSYPTLSGLESMETIAAVVAVGAGLVFASYGDRILGKFNLPEYALRHVRNLFLVRGRDVTMSQAVISDLDEHPESGSMLVIVGSNHVEGLVRFLENQAGMREIQLPAAIQ